MYVVGSLRAGLVQGCTIPHWWPQVQVDAVNACWHNMRVKKQGLTRPVLYYLDFGTDTIHVLMSNGTKAYRAFTYLDFMGSGTIKATFDTTQGYLPEPEGYETPKAVEGFWINLELSIQKEG